ncbi:hydroxyacid dehydrogenase [Clostridium thermosuccinogenes]|uniref:hydroxyacid dehydrogenase n=1 Tax=Clostridium thermosuccinogenes TaxID=84032 RepID=UPI0013747CD3|nr:hydroxyacid dehydrogenase [Pseudoclostridium thermosuccinogenes]
MKNIVFMMNAKQRKNIFKQEDIDIICRYGNTIYNTDEHDPDQERAKEIAMGANIIITSWGCPQLSKDVLDQAPDLELIIHAAGSVKGIISDEVWRRGIRVSSSAQALGIGVAETAVGFTITAIKNMWSLSANTRAGKWSEGREKVREVYGITIGVIGAGRAGTHYIKLMNNFDVRILLYDPFIDREKAAALGAEKSELDELLKESDVVSVHAPSIPETYHMINADRLAVMKDDAVLINTARGSIIDENALITELKKGRLFACIDVTDPEPPSEDHPFRSLPNVILTPHIAGAVNNGLYRIGRYVANEIRLYEKGEEMDGEVFESKINSLA